jgi:hypothetical protein
MMRLASLLKTILVISLLAVGCSPEKPVVEIAEKEEVVITVEAEQPVEATMMPAPDAPEPYPTLSEEKAKALALMGNRQKTLDQLAGEEATKVAISWIGTLVDEAGSPIVGKSLGIGVEIYNAVGTLKNAEENFKNLIDKLIAVARRDAGSCEEAARALMELYGVPKQYWTAPVIKAKEKLEKWQGSISDQEQAIQSLRSLKAQFEIAKNTDITKTEGSEAKEKDENKYRIRWKTWQVPGEDKWEWDYTVTNLSGSDITYFEIQFPRSLPVAEVLLDKCDDYDIAVDKLCDAGEGLYKDDGYMTIPKGWNCKCDKATNSIKFWVRSSPCYDPINKGEAKTFKFLVGKESRGVVGAVIARWSNADSRHVNDEAVAVGGQGE